MTKSSPFFMMSKLGPEDGWTVHSHSPNAYKTSKTYIFSPSEMSGHTVKSATTPFDNRQMFFADIQTYSLVLKRHRRKSHLHRTLRDRAAANRTYRGNFPALMSAYKLPKACERLLLHRSSTLKYLESAWVCLSRSSQQSRTGKP